MEIIQGNSMYNYIYLRQTKVLGFSFSLFCKIEEQEGRTGPSRGGGLIPVGGERWQEKG
jgi:hypothetical protein